MRNHLLPIIAALTWCSQASALELTVEQCLALGLNNNHTLKARQSEVESSRQDVRIARSGFLPTIEARGSYFILDQPPRFVIDKDLFGPNSPDADTEIRGDEDNYMAGVTLRQTLYAGGRITHAYQRDNQLLVSVQHEFGNQRTRFAYDLKKNFYETLIQQAYSDSFSQQVTTRQEGLRIASALAKEGQLSEDKVLQARANLLFSEAEFLQAQQRADNSLDQLRRLLALDENEALTLVDVATYPLLGNTAVELSAAVLDQREDYKQLEAQIMAAEENLKVARSRYHPEISAEGGYLRQRETNITQQDLWVAGINLTWPLFEGWKTDAEVVKAQAEKQRLESLRRDLAMTIRNEVQAGLRQVQYRQMLVEAYLVNLQGEERSYSDTLARQEHGEVLAIEAHEQKARLLLAQANYLESVNQLRIAIAALQAMTASPLDGLLEYRDIYNMALAPQVKEPASPEPEKPSTKAPAVPAATPAGAGTEPGMPSPPAAGPADDNAYAIQLGAFKSKAKAQTFIKTLNARYPGESFQTIATNGLYKVRSASYQSHAIALATLAKFDDQGFVVRAETKR